MSRKITRRTFAASSAAAAAVAGFGFKPALAQAYPARPVTLIVPWGAGGGTDATARIIAALLEKDLGQPFNVVNRTGGSGVVGHSAIATAPPDGYTIGMITVEISMMHWQGLTELAPKSYTPLGAGERRSARHPGPLRIALQDGEGTRRRHQGRAAGKFKASGTGQGGIWHLALVGWMQAMGLAPNHVRLGAVERRRARDAGSRRRRRRPHHLLGAGSARASSTPARRAASPSWRRSAIRAFPDVPTLKEAMGSDYSTGAWRGIAGPKGLPADVATKLTASLKKVYDSKEFKDFMSNRGFGTVWGDAARIRDLHGQGRRPDGRGDEGRRPRRRPDPIG